MSEVRSSLPFADATATLLAIREGTVSATEVLAHYTAEISRLNPQLNCLITTTDMPEKPPGQHTPLAGMPLVHKDIFSTRGTLTTCGSRMLSNYVAPFDATVVERLHQAGTVVLGKANMDEFAMGSSNENSYFGPVRNPWDLALVPGGSSGGSAAAVAAGMTPWATGTDTGGSIRQPAAFCGITGLKPTYGRVSRYGMIAFASSLDQGGPMARSARDTALLFAHMYGHDPRDATSHPQPDAWLEAIAQGNMQPLQPAGSLKGLRIGLPREYLDIDDAAATAFQAMADLLQAQGATLQDISLPHTHAAVAAYYVIAGAEASTNLSRFDGVRFGHRADGVQNLAELYERSRSEGFGAEVKRRILTGTYALSVGYFDAYYLKAQKIRRLVQQDFLKAFADVDLILSPTTPGPAFAIGALGEDPVAMYRQDLFTIPVSLAGLPALALPTAPIGELPFGVQLIAPHFAERRALEAGIDLQQVSDWHIRTPSFRGATL